MWRTSYMYMQCELEIEALLVFRTVYVLQYVNVHYLEENKTGYDQCMYTVVKELI